MSQKRFLVIVRAGDTSCHPGWTESASGRTWDLVVSYFGADPQRYRNDHDRRVDDKGQKWEGLHALLTRTDFWRDYDFVWLPDDDLAVEQAGIDRLFALMQGMDLDLAQPTLDWHSHLSHPITLRWPSFSVRFSNFVEIMAPCFKRDFLDVCMPTFAETLSGWGLDFVWPTLLGEDIRRCGMLDDVSVTHTRVVGGPTHDGLRDAGVSARSEGRETLRRYGIPRPVRQMITGAIDRNGRFLHGGNARDIEAMNALMASDVAAAQAYRKSVARELLGTPQGLPPLPALSITELGAVVAANIPRR